VAETSRYIYDLCIVGGCGHVGTPLGMSFASAGKKVALYDVNKKSIDLVNKGIMPFKENGADKLLPKLIKSKSLRATDDPSSISQAKVVIMVIGTPVDEHLNPKAGAIIDAVKEIEGYLQDDQLLIMRSTLYPGITNKVYDYLKSRGKKTMVSFCPERIAEGYALTEIKELPQIVSGCTPEAADQAEKFFKLLAKKIIRLEPTEAELAKLFTNTWRYINFAISNQFYMIATDQGLDFYKLHDAMVDDYPRLKSFAKAGLAAGPCLFKDTMQLSSYSGNNFFLGHAAMLINEGLPDFIVETMRDKYFLKHQTIGLLGMAFKGNSDDPRESLSYKLEKKLQIEAKEVLCHDPYVKDDELVDLDEIRKKADIIVLATPHSVYANDDWSDREVVDIWNFYGKGATI
jgi:UDP-N-acetyl-D-mannosaminuronic acid dehydrogenase